MTVSANSTVPLPTVQPAAVFVDTRWAAEILPLLPPDLAAHARARGAFTRARGLASPAALLRALLAYVLCCSSLAHLGAWAVLVDVADLSAPAWGQCLRRAAPWLGWLLTTLLSRPTPAPPGGPRVLLIDGSTVRPPGGGPDWRWHSAYDLRAGRLHSLRLTDDHTGEHLEHYALAAGDIVVADSGYGYRRSVAVAHRQGAAVVLRIWPTTCPLETSDGTAVDVVAWLGSAARRQRERALYVRYRKQRYAVRVIAQRLSAAATAKARARKRAKARRDGRTIQAATLAAAGWRLILTTLPEASWPTDAVLRLYRGRWQVELLFKRIKQLLRVAEVRVQRREAVEAVLALYLIAWALQERAAGTLLAQLPQGAPPGGGPLSRWRVGTLLVEEVRGAVRGGWTAARRAVCAPRLLRYLRSSPRRRRCQEQRLQEWFAKREAAVTALLARAAA
jgi:hypothetical protein